MKRENIEEANLIDNEIKILEGIKKILTTIDLIAHIKVRTNLTFIPDNHYKQLIQAWILTFDTIIGDLNTPVNNLIKELEDKLETL